MPRKKSGRRKNGIDTKQLTVSLTPQIYGLLTKIANSGFAAKTEASVAEEMIRHGLNWVNGDGLIGKLLHQTVLGKKK